MLLDTCALIWLAQNSRRITRPTKDRIAKANSVYVSAISAFEIGHKSAKGDLDLPLPAFEWYSRVLEHHDILEIPVDGQIAFQAAQLPKVHKDPADRMIIATAKLYKLPVVTADEVYSDYGIEILI